MTNNSKVHFILGWWLGSRWFGWRCGVNPITDPPRPRRSLPPPSIHQPPLHVPIIAFASCFQVRTERRDWLRLGCGLFLYRSARLRLQLRSSCCTHRSAESFTDGLKNIPAWKCWRADSEPPSGLVSRSNLPSALLFFKSPSGDKQVGDVQYIYAQATQHARVGLETILKRNTHAERRWEPGGIFTIETQFLCQEE